MSLHRACCCGADEKCCDLWCECPDTITVTTCKFYNTGTMYACDQGYPNTPCAQPNGTEIGACYSAVKLNSVKFVKVTGSQASGEVTCTGCCRYVVATGEDQTGTVQAWRDDYLLWCSEEDGDECARGNRSVEGTFTRPLSGDQGTWELNELSGFLQVECCNGTCDDNSFKAVLELNVQGGDTDAASLIDCCDQSNTRVGLTVDIQIDYEWDCRHKSRWAGTCPCDLMQEPGEGSIYWTVTQNIGLCANIDCDGVGQQADYSSPCIVDPPVISYSAVLSDDLVDCSLAGNNGFLESIGGC